MSTIILEQPIENINFNNLKLGDQFIRVTSNKESIYDMHESIILTDIKKDCLFSFKTIRLLYGTNREAQSEITYENYIKILNNVIKTSEDVVSNMYKDIDFFNIINTIDNSYLMENNMGVINISETKYLFYCKIPFENNYLFISLLVEVKSEFINKKMYVAIFNNESKKYIYVDVKDNNKFMNDIEKLNLSSEFLEFKNKIYDVCNYNINKFIDGIDNTEFKSLFNGDADKYFNPIYIHNKFEIYLDYELENRRLVYLYNKVPFESITDEYKRILHAIEKYYFEDSSFNPFKGFSRNDEVIYKDLNGLILSNWRGNKSKTLIYNIYVYSTEKENNEIFERYKICQNLIGSK